LAQSDDTSRPHVLRSGGDDINGLDPRLS
jgi:hypothetical protein